MFTLVWGQAPGLGGIVSGEVAWSLAELPEVVASHQIRITKAIGEVKKAILKGSRDIPIRQAAAHG